MLPPPRGGFRRLSWGCAALRGHKRTRLGRIWVAPGPFGVFTPLGHTASTPACSRSCGRPSLGFRSPSELDHRDPVPSRRSPGTSDDTSSPGLSLPYDTVSNRQTRCRRRIPPPPRAAYGVWLPPARPAPPVLPMRQAHRSVHGLHPSRSSPRHDRCSSRSPCLPAVTAPRQHRPGGRRARRKPASRPCSRDESVLPPEPRVIPAVDPFLGFAPPERAPVRPGVRFGRDASPLVLRRLDV
jgi:hypothetical protein